MGKPPLKKEQQDNNEFIPKHKGRVIPPQDLPKIEDAGEVIFCRDIMTAFVIVHKHK
ncbi:hypothetical protein GQS62_03990 [Pediococcus pentosaceus]|uniref:hypothetical protein n=1 Tax=Pediococcus pentosaceus TaxID=1255 RepID=UPI0013032E59|nr:hypothetical protein [Pediococcus pentosaceus]QGZ70016.1 hypothetical protein GQS62_03990 [Pediococcus pentosaceus]